MINHIMTDMIKFMVKITRFKITDYNTKPMVLKSILEKYPPKIFYCVIKAMNTPHFYQAHQHQLIFKHPKNRSLK